MWVQKFVDLKPKPRGFHLIDNEILNAIPELRRINVGLLHILIKHTSASITLNENADPTVRSDFERHFNQFVPENAPYYEHTYEGSDDMPAHIKSTIIGTSQTLPVTNGQLNMGTWQGIYLCEHRNHAGSRQLVLTLQGE